MKTVFTQLLYKQFYQEQLLNQMFLEDENPELFDTVVDNMEVILDYIGYPKDQELDLDLELNFDYELDEDYPEPICRDMFYQYFTEIPYKDLEDEDMLKNTITNYLYWMCIQTKKVCKEENLEVNKNLKKLLKEFKKDHVDNLHMYC